MFLVVASLAENLKIVWCDVVDGPVFEVVALKVVVCSTGFALLSIFGELLIPQVSPVLGVKVDVPVPPSP